MFGLHLITAGRHVGPALVCTSTIRAESAMPARPKQPRDGPVPPRLMLQYLVVLAGTDPLVWRRIRVPASYSFWDLHVAIQDSMGWLDYHLHEFRVLDPRSGTIMKLGIPDDEGWDDAPLVADWLEFPLDYVVGSPPPMQYTYDFGDDWTHAVIFEGFEHAPGRRKLRPECVGGGGRCPPEDCGGVHGYTELLAALADVDHPEHDEYLEWAGAPIDPAVFSANSVQFDDPAKRWRIAFEGGAD